MCTINSIKALKQLETEIDTILQTKQKWLQHNSYSLEFKSKPSHADIMSILA